MASKGQTENESRKKQCFAGIAQARLTSSDLGPGQYFDGKYPRNIRVMRKRQPAMANHL